MTSPTKTPLSMTEEQLLIAITEAATLYGWRWHHVRRSDKALQQGHAGFPDIVAVRGGRLLFLELKAGRGIVSNEQVEWLNDLADVAGMVESRVVWPTDLDSTLAMLR